MRHALVTHQPVIGFFVSSRSGCTMKGNHNLYIEYGSEVHPSAARQHTFRPLPGDSSASDSPVISHLIPEYLVIWKPASAYRGPPAATNEAPRVHGVYKNLHPRYVEYESGICWMRERTAAAHARMLSSTESISALLPLTFLLCDPSLWDKERS